MRKGAKNDEDTRRKTSIFNWFLWLKYNHKWHLWLKFH
jgi:hypothetical protein